MKTKKKTLADLKSLKENVLSDPDAPFAGVFYKVEIGKEGENDEFIGVSETSENPGSMGVFREVLGFSFSDLKEGPKGNKFYLSKGQLREIGNNWFKCVEEMSDYDPTKHQNVVRVKYARKWRKYRLLLVIYKNKEDMPV